MKYIFICKKNENAISDKFHQDIQVVQNEIKNILDEYDVSVEIIDGNKIEIFFENEKHFLSLRDCKQKIKKSFSIGFDRYQKSKSSFSVVLPSSDV